MSTRSTIDKWASFLAAEKLTPQRGDAVALIRLAEELAERSTPVFQPYAKRLESRRLVVNTAMDAEIDLAGMKHNGKIAMSRGLLDIWNQEYAKRFGSAYGTAGQKEATRRDVKTKLRNKW